MASERATITYSVAEPFEQTVKSLRKVLARARLTITGELNMSDRIHRNLLIGIAPCLVLFVSPCASLLETMGADPCAAALIPLHIVVSGRGMETDIHVLRIPSAHHSPLDTRAMTGLNAIQAEISQAIEQIGMRSALGA